MGVPRDHRVSLAARGPAVRTFPCTVAEPLLDHISEAVTAFAGGLLNAYDRFGVPAFTPVLLNVCLIFAVLVAAPWFEQPAMALAWGVFVAGAVQLAFQWQLIDGAVSPRLAGCVRLLAVARPRIRQI